MKKLMSSLTIGLLFVGSSFLTSCGSSSSNSEEQGKEYTSAYICPMHCDGSGSEEPGKCPVCGMDYEANENHQHDGHQHEGHQHSH